MRLPPGRDVQSGPGEGQREELGEEGTGGGVLRSPGCCPWSRCSRGRGETEPVGTGRTRGPGCETLTHGPFPRGSRSVHD